MREMERRTREVEHAMAERPRRGAGRADGAAVVPAMTSGRGGSRRRRGDREVAVSSASGGIKRKRASGLGRERERREEETGAPWPSRHGRSSPRRR